MSSLALVDVAKHFGAVEALRPLSLDLAHGEVMVVTGPGGSGKSTLLRLVAGLETPDSGDVFLAGKMATRVTANRRDVAMVTPDQFAHPRRAVGEAMRKAMPSRRFSPAEKRNAVAETADLLGLTYHLETRWRDCPLLARRLTQLGMAVLSEAGALLLDDPFAGLDPHARREARWRFMDLLASRPRTVLLATRQPLEGLILGNCLAVLHGGLLRSVSAPAEAFRAPRHVDVATWLGDPGMCVLPAARVGDRRLECAPAIGLTLPFERARLLPEDDPACLVAFRPEDLRLESLDHPPARGPRYQQEHLFWETPILAMEPHGEGGRGALVRLALNSRPVLASTPAWPPFATGANVHVAVPAARCHVFRALDGRLLTPAEAVAGM